MEPLTESIDLDIDESNELAFKIRMEGAAATPAKVRLVCEGGDVSYMFNGYGTNEPEVVQFTLPQMSGKINEGTYQARVEVLVDNRYFAPLRFDINFKKTVSVVAEAVKIVQKPRSQEVKVTATPVTQQRSIVPQVIEFEKKPERKLSESANDPFAPANHIAKKDYSLRDVYTKKLSESKQKSK